MELNSQNGANNWHGSLQLEFDRIDRATKLVCNKGIAPLRVQKPFYPEGESVCHSTILHTAGGVVGGDRLATKIHIRPEAHALITTATAAKIYRSNGKEAQQTIHIKVDREACLEWLPQETIAFAGAVYRQNLQIELAENACWMGWEIVRYGRSASGEKFLSGNWRSHTEVWRQGQPLWIDRQWLKGDPAIVASPHGLAGYPVVASFAIIGRHVAPDLIDQIRQLWLKKYEQGEYTGEAGVTNLLEGALCRYRGNSTLEVRQWFMAVWHLLRLSYINRPACIPRVWQI